MSGLKLLMGAIAAGSSPSSQTKNAAALNKTNSNHSHNSHAPTPRNGDSGGGGFIATPQEARGGGDAEIMSPAVVSRARRLLLGVSNIDKSVDARRLAAEALASLT